jgi:cell division septal protein FtsQ
MMMTPRNRQRPKQTDEWDDWDDEPGRPGVGRRPAAAASDLADRHRRTSKHRAPKQKGRPPQRRPTPEQSARPKKKESDSRKQTSLVERISPDFFTKRLIRTIWVIFCTVAFVTIILLVYFFLVPSRFFALRDIEIVGDPKLLQREFIEAIAQENTKEGVLRADLDKIREELQKKGVVKSVEITRMLPDMLKIVIEEREPVALARRGDSRAESEVVCVDREGIMFGDQSICRSKSELPLINGLEEGGDGATARNQQRLAVYQKLLSDLDGAEPRLSSRVEEVYFDQAQGIRVTIEAPDKESVIAVFLGKEEFRIRFNAALDVLDAINRQDAEALNVLRISDAEKLLSGARISYLNATTPKRVVVGLEE